MTHSIDAPFPPPVPATTGTTTTESPSTKDAAKDEARHTRDVAKDEARNVGQTASQAGSQVASTATDQAKQVAGETQRQAKDLVDQGRSQLKDQAVGQQQKAAEGLNSIAQQMRGLADGSSEGAPGPVRDLLQQASGSVESFASMLQNKEPAELLDEVRRFARRKPGMFLLGAAVAGIAAGRMTSGVKAAHSDSGSGNHGYQGTPTNYVDPAPTYSDYSAATTGVPTGTGAPLPPPPYGTVPPAGAAMPPAGAAAPPAGAAAPPATPAGWDNPARRPGGVA
ncbi:hypothetical protein [Blastococcus saxobsidens]|uniref:Uncharacterized protein n=1 Tax=Blastococcus saxobsidens (strain DD2) TaxID=1146883 RepID=H6RW68_BLASD|nr:hypothetical protein [Blastococcus saxobsidens]CCG02085.1 conserved protein of unknown function [Blastococcus saxobsidens DD2]